MTGSKPPLLTRFLADEAATLALGAELARVLQPGLVVYLIGDLGSGKTTLARGVLRGLGYSGRVKSPTYTLVEVYKFSKLYLYHFDFYRFESETGLREAGFLEYFRVDSVCLVEWPEHARGLPPADWRVSLSESGNGRGVEVYADTEAGKLCLDRMQR